MLEGYIGYTKDLKRTWRRHSNRNYKVGNAIRKYKDDIIFETLHSFKTIDEALDKECFYRPTCSIGWNLKPGGSTGDPGIEGRKKISKYASNRDYSHMKGENHHYFGGRSDLDQTGGKNPMAVKCQLYGKTFTSIKEASDHFKIPYNKCYRMIRNPG